MEAQARALEELPPVPDKEDLDGSMVDPKERQLATPGRPIGEPVELRPLFSEEQIMALDAVQQQAPHLHGGARRLQGLADALPLPRPAFLMDEERKTPLKEVAAGERDPGGGQEGPAVGWRVAVGEF